MKKIDWKSKLSSRKFWSAVAGFISSVMYAFGAAETATARVVGVVTAAGVVCVYMLAEAITDAERGKE